MARFTDGKKTVELKMVVWEGTQYSPDMSNDILEIGKYDINLDAYVVDDVDYIIDYAMDWKESCGDFSDDEPDSNREVSVDEL